MKLVISFVIASLLFFVLMVPAEAQQREKRTTLQQKGSQTPQESNYLRTKPGEYYESADGIKPLGSPVDQTESGKEVILTRKLPPLIIIRSKLAPYKIEELRLGPVSSFSFTMSTRGSSMSFGYSFAPDNIKPIVGNPRAFRVMFERELIADEYILFSEYTDKKDGQRKIILHSAFRVK
jgi:hypothetical protein